MFEDFAKIARLSRDIVITEKIDGTNAQIAIEVLPDGPGSLEYLKYLDSLGFTSPQFVEVEETLYALQPGSRKRYIGLDSDNFGFARWVSENKEELVKLGPGRHYGEWWGQGIQRGYGLTEKRFSLINTHRWGVDRPTCCHVVPVLYTGPFETALIEVVLNQLEERGSQAAPGFMNPEGVIIYHTQGNVLFKKTLYHDDKPKSLNFTLP